MVTVKRLAETPAKDVSDGKEIVGVQKQVLVGPGDGAPTFAIRRFVLSPGGHTPAHAHPFEHGVVVLRGEGVVVTPNGPLPLGEGTAVFVPPGEHHQFRNTGSGPLEFLCVIPVAYET